MEINYLLALLPLGVFIFISESDCFKLDKSGLISKSRLLSLKSTKIVETSLLIV